MTLIEQAKTAIFELADLAAGDPDPVSVIHVQAKLIRLHAELGQEMCVRFSAKERAYLARKIAEASQYKANRFDVDGKARKPAADANRDAELAVADEYGRQIDSAQEFESYRTLLRSLQNSLDFARSLVSFYKDAQSNS